MSLHKKHSMKMIAHRGAAGYCPENTLASFTKALDMEADLLELDIHLSKDGQLVVIHDHTLNRTTDVMGKVSDYTLEQLRGLDAGRWFGKAFAGERIPTLKEVIELAADKAGLLIEIKEPDKNPGIEQRLAAELRESGLSIGEVIVQSFDQGTITRFHEIMPSIAVGILVDRNQSVTDPKLKEYKAFCKYVNPSLGLISKELVDRIHHHGMKVFAWTVRTPEVVGPLVEHNVDGLITDFPDYVK